MSSIECISIWVCCHDDIFASTRGIPHHVDCVAISIRVKQTSSIKKPIMNVRLMTVKNICTIRATMLHKVVGTNTLTIVQAKSKSLSSVTRAHCMINRQTAVEQPTIGQSVSVIK